MAGSGISVMVASDRSHLLPFLVGGDRMGNAPQGFYRPRHAPVGLLLRQRAPKIDTDQTARHSSNYAEFIYEKG